MFLKKETFKYNGQSVVLHQISALQRVEYFDYLASKEAISDEGSESLRHTAQLVRLNVDVNAWLISRSLSHETAECDENELHQTIQKTWPSEAINEAVEIVLALSGMHPKSADEAAPSPDTVEPVEEKPLAK